MNLPIGTLLFSCCWILLLSSCVKDDETAPTTVAPGPNGVFLGTWYVAEESKLYGNATYYLSIADSSDNNYVLISRLYGYKTKTTATTSSSSIIIPSQIIEANRVSGNGILLNNNRLHLTYYVDTGFDLDTIHSVLTK